MVHTEQKLTFGDVASLRASLAAIPAIPTSTPSLSPQSPLEGTRDDLGLEVVKGGVPQLHGLLSLLHGKS